MISFIVPCHNNLGGLFTCLESLYKQDPDNSRYEIIVVLDNPPPKIGKVVEEILSSTTKFRAKPFLKEKREGFSSAVNFGIQRADPNSKILVLTNDDIEFVSPVVDPILAAFAEDPKIALVGAKLWFPNGSIQHAGTLWSLAPDGGPYHNGYKESDRPSLNKGRDCLVTGALLAIRASALKEIGLFDTEYKMSYEDTEYGMKAFEMGYRCVYRPSIRAIHAEGSTRRADPFEKPNAGYSRFRERWAKYASLPEYPPGNNLNRIWTVKPGDTLDHIAQVEYGDARLSHALKSANPGVTAENLQVGTRLIVPAK